MPHAFDIEVVAVDHKVYTGQAVSVTIPGADGYFGILSGHAPLIASLGVGVITIAPPTGQPVVLAVSGGFAEVVDDHVTILAETAELAHEIDVERARLAVERARGRLVGVEEGTDFDRARAALMRALNRLRVAGDRS
ncbi:MAG: ATP synthase F1 subunit epsilon [Armatimonadota bacterium]